MSFSIARYASFPACIEEVVVFLSAVLGARGVLVVAGGCWLVLSLGNVGGGVLGNAGGWSGSCVFEPGVIVGGVGFGVGAGVLLPCKGGVGIGVWTPVLAPCCSGDLLRGAGVCVSGLSVLGKSAPLRLHRLVGSSVGGVEELAVETGGV